MSQAFRIEPPVTILEFDAFLDAQQDDALWELVAGCIVAMTDPNEDHEQIAGNIGAPLKLAMDPKGCRAYQGGIRREKPRGGACRAKSRGHIQSSRRQGPAMTPFACVGSS